jgi:hypothetical protein
MLGTFHQLNNCLKHLFLLLSFYDEHIFVMSINFRIQSLATLLFASQMKYNIEDFFCKTTFSICVEILSPFDTPIRSFFYFYVFLEALKTTYYMLAYIISALASRPSFNWKKYYILIKSFQ